MNISSSVRKAETERRAFLDFVERIGEKDIWHSVESRDPPEPDLLCMHVKRGLIAFELVAITDPLIAQVNAGDALPGMHSFSTSDPSERIIRKKLKRKYKTEYPLELLVYNDLLVITPDDDIVATILPWIGSISHPFQRVWFMGQYLTECIWNAG
jgi:hypothetical protein